MSRIKTYTIENATDEKCNLILPPEAKTIKRILVTAHEDRSAGVADYRENTYPAFVSLAMKSPYGIDLPTLAASSPRVHFNTHSLPINLETNGTLKVLVKNRVLSYKYPLTLKIIIEY